MELPKLSLCQLWPNASIADGRGAHLAYLLPHLAYPFSGQLLIAIGCVVFFTDAGMKQKKPIVWQR